MKSNTKFSILGLIIPFLMGIIHSCSNDSKNFTPSYTVEQDYESDMIGIDVIYKIKTYVRKYFSNGDGIVHKSIVDSVASNEIDSVISHEKSIANMYISEFKRIDQLIK